MLNLDGATFENNSMGLIITHYEDSKIKNVTATNNTISYDESMALVNNDYRYDYSKKVQSN